MALIVATSRTMRLGETGDPHQPRAVADGHEYVEHAQ